jgi:selenide, water dikinase
MGPGDLSRALAPLVHRVDPRLLVGTETFDDAGVFRLSDDLALVQTVDFFAPIVDDPYAFGQVAAANALSDVYAMGAEPLTALNIAAFPAAGLPPSVLTEILRGGLDKVHEAGAFVVGGHTILDDEVKFGLAVTGVVHPDRILTNAAARAGDRLLLTKPLGTGLLATAAKAGTLGAADAARMLASMLQLNAAASRVAVELRVRCATDVTGFGLLGHLSHITRASDVSARIAVAAVPILPGAVAAWRAGARTGGADRNADYLAPFVDWGNSTAEERALLLDPQTSGGLLLAMPAESATVYLSRVPGAVDIGEVLEPRGERSIQLA